MERRSFLTTATLATAGNRNLLTTSCINKKTMGFTKWHHMIVNDFVLDEETISSLRLN
jgi:hypothetical protein